MTTKRPDQQDPAATHPEALAGRLPPGFLVGVATSAFQIEGALAHGGRGMSTWDRFMDKPRRIVDGSTAAIAADHYHRYRDDVALMKQLGIDLYRFSLAWPRIQPGGSGPANVDGVDFYDRLIDELLAAGIRPMVTLYHWDTPEPLQKSGGWLNRDTAYRLADYAALAAEAFGDRVHSWVTINEPATVALNGYGLGLHAPGASVLFDSMPAVHHQLLGHGLAVQALRAAGVIGQVGIANVHSPIVPATRRIRDRYFAAVFDHLHNRIFADPVLLGRYPRPPIGSGKLFRALREADPADLATIAQPLDFYGLNYYMPIRIAAGAMTSDTVADAPIADGAIPDAAIPDAALDESTDAEPAPEYVPGKNASGGNPDGSDPGMGEVPFSLLGWPDLDQTGFGWPIAPHYLGVALQQLAKRYGTALPPVYITESGASFDDAVAADGSVIDSARIDYLARHLAAALDSTDVDLRGFVIWSLMDNWEWAAGYTQRFGLVHVDFQTQERTPKASFHWLQRLLAAR